MPRSLAKPQNAGSDEPPGPPLILMHTDVPWPPPGPLMKPVPLPFAIAAGAASSTAATATPRTTILRIPDLLSSHRMLPLRPHRRVGSIPRPRFIRMDWVEHHPRR